MAPDVEDAFRAFSQKVFANGALPAKTKQLIAIAVAHVTQCPYCIKGHTKAARRHGATPEEINRGHPDNDGHALRIPQGAEPWDSGYLVEPGDRFEVTLTVPGVYDYFCTPHEAAGMVGRIIVGQPVGPGTMPFDYFRDDPATRHWRAVPKAAQVAFPPIAAIMNERVVRATV